MVAKRKGTLANADVPFFVIRRKPQLFQILFLSAPLFLKVKKPLLV